jgi:hypothetical protein
MFSMPPPGKDAQTATFEDGIQSDLRSQGLVMNHSFASLELKSFGPMSYYDKLRFLHVRAAGYDVLASYIKVKKVKGKDIPVTGHGGP